MTRAIEVQSAPPPPEPVVEVVLLTVEEASPDIPEVQSPTLMIQDVKGELSSEKEAVEAYGVVEEEEGSSSTMRKKIPRIKGLLMRLKLLKSQ